MNEEIGVSGIANRESNKRAKQIRTMKCIKYTPVYNTFVSFLSFVCNSFHFANFASRSFFDFLVTNSGKQGRFLCLKKAKTTRQAFDLTFNLKPLLIDL